MMVYGDRRRTVDAGDLLDALAARAYDPPALDDPLDRHAATVQGLIEAGSLLQGVADREFRARGADAPSMHQDAAATILMSFAHATARSWYGGFRPGLVPLARPALEALRGFGPVDIVEPEGYAHYALYPETYLEATRGFSASGGAVRVIGIRSIGTGLAALVAAGLGEAAPLTVRPVGHPFERRLELAPALRAALAADPDAGFAVVDEGPGLSGSSFLATVDALESLGVDAGRITLFPSHSGEPGTAAGEERRARWRGLRRLHHPIDRSWSTESTPWTRLATWVEDLVGPLGGPLREISGGAWRHLPGRGAAGVASVRGQERRKFLAETAAGKVLVKFAGLGSIGETKLALARRLAEEGHTPVPLGLRHGFLVERWDDGRPLGPGFSPDEAFLGQLATMLGLRARQFRANAADGADIATLATIVQRNTEHLGGDAGGYAAVLRRNAEALQRLSEPVRIDGRLARHEWIRGSDGHLVKTDAVDHHAGHDLVGCQDIAWDVAGAAVEFDLDEAATEELRRRTEIHAGRRVARALVTFHRFAYAAFHLGRTTMAAESEGDPAEAALLRAEAARYATAILREPVAG